MSDILRCPECSAELAPDSPAGLCPACLLNQGFFSGSRNQGEKPSNLPTANAASQPDSRPGPGPTRPFTPSGRFVAPKPEDLAGYFPQLEIIELVGQGGMGAVYKARQRQLNRIIALKILPPDTAQDPSFGDRFIREAQSLAHLNHPRIVTVHDFGETGGLYYFIMEFVDGTNLRQLIADRKLEPREALVIVPQICDALQVAHDAGVVHRDIKPENILIDKRGQVKIADFGLAKLLLRPGASPPVSSERITYSGQIMGTPHYMAPEQMERPLSVDHRADIYSLGVVFYEMLTGELPLGRFAPPSRMVHMDVRLDEVVLRSLEKEPQRRYQHASEVKTDLETISRTSNSSRVDSAPVPPPVLDSDFEMAQDEVRGPAIGLVVIGVIQVLLSLLVILGGAFFIVIPYSAKSQNDASSWESRNPSDRIEMQDTNTTLPAPVPGPGVEP